MAYITAAEAMWFACFAATIFSQLWLEAAFFGWLAFSAIRRHLRYSDQDDGNM